MSKIIFEFGYEGGCDIVRIEDSQIHFHTELHADFQKEFANIKDWWEYYTTINKYWTRSVHRFKISDELKSLVKESLIKKDIIAEYNRGVERSKSGVIDYEKRIKLMKEKFNLPIHSRLFRKGSYSNKDKNDLPN